MELAKAGSRSSGSRFEKVRFRLSKGQVKVRSAKARLKVGKGRIKVGEARSR